MVKHIVMWNVRGRDRTDALDQARRLRELLANLADRIPSVHLLEVGIQEDEAPRIVLYSEFAGWDALEKYRIHPDHLAVIPVLREVTEKVGFVDYEV
jgi:hypothetical protein